MNDTISNKFGFKVEAGTKLFSAGDPGDDMYVVRSGSVRVFLEAGGTEKTLAILGVGEFVGEMSLLNGTCRSANAVMHETGELLIVKGRLLEDMIVHNTEIGLRLIKRLAKRLETADSLIKVLLHRDPRDRVVENFKRLVALHDGSGDEIVTVAADIKGMAEQVGLQADEVHEIVSRMIKAQIIVEENGAWLIKEPERLDEFLLNLKKKAQFQ